MQQNLEVFYFDKKKIMICILSNTITESAKNNAKDITLNFGKYIQYETMILV